MLLVGRLQVLDEVDDFVVEAQHGILNRLGGLLVPGGYQLLVDVLLRLLVLILEAQNQFALVDLDALAATFLFEWLLSLSFHKYYNSREPIASNL